MSAASISRRERLRVTGIVQGVGFRPFVYQEALRRSLGGFVLNDGEGVVIEIEGTPDACDAFYDALNRNAPPLARIDSVSREAVACRRESGFAIRPSEAGSARTMVSPDMALCDVCAAELKDPSDRRYRYPFINCTDCGPRYTIIRSLPYDRPNTSMAPFAMCHACEKEYGDPSDRRYHAQPVSCYDCGPVLSLLETDGRAVATGAEALERACTLILRGETVAVKGMGGFHLVCDAGNEGAVQCLRERKRRPAKPLAVMFPEMESLRRAAALSEADERLILSKARPIVLVNKRSPSGIAPSVAPGIGRIGVFLPNTPLHLLLLERVGRPVVATSANFSDAPIIIDEETLLRTLGHVVSAVLCYDRAIVNACDDSVAMVAAGQEVLMRMARGYAPRSLPLKHATGRKVLAVGANQKSAIALAFGGHLILSPHIGDLGSLEAFAYFERTLETFKRFYAFEPDVIVCDRHPGYETTLWARRFALEHGTELLEVQHHYAHALACMAEYGLEEEVLAFCFDGTGYGDDETVWGGEVLRADPKTYRRIGHLRPFRLLGGDKAVKEPCRIALALLFECFTLEEVLSMPNPAVRSFSDMEVRILHRMWERGTNAPQCSSVGRLFDAVASLCGMAQSLTYEGEGGLLIESAAGSGVNGEGFDYTVTEGVLDWGPMLDELLRAPAAAAAAGKLIAMLADFIARTAGEFPELPVVLGGGVFQNRLLVEATAARLDAAGVRWYLQRQTPVNDGGIALGQLYYALQYSGG